MWSFGFIHITTSLKGEVWKVDVDSSLSVDSIWIVDVDPPKYISSCSSMFNNFGSCSKQEKVHMINKHCYCFNKSFQFFLLEKVSVAGCSCLAFVQSFAGFYVLTLSLNKNFQWWHSLGTWWIFIPPLSTASMTWLRQGLEYSPFVLFWDQPLLVDLFLKMGLVDFKRTIRHDSMMAWCIAVALFTVSPPIGIGTSIMEMTSWWHPTCQRLSMSTQQNNHLQFAVLQFLFFAQKRRPAPTRNPDVTQVMDDSSKGLPMKSMCLIPCKPLCLEYLRSVPELSCFFSHQCQVIITSWECGCLFPNFDWPKVVKLVCPTKWICDWFWLMVRYLFNKCHQGHEARYKKINKTKRGNCDGEKFLDILKSQRW